MAIVFRRPSGGLAVRVALLAALVPIGLVPGPAGRGTLAHADHGMPARLHQGTCDAIGPVAFELNGVGATADLDGNELPAPELLGAPTAAAVEAGVTTVSATLDAIASGGHALKIYQSDDAMDVAVACGDVGGIVVDGDLIVGLTSTGAEGMTGLALLRSEGDQTIVGVFLLPASAAEGADEGTPGA